VSAAPPDPRPLAGEPLALDLLDTEHVIDGAQVDLLADGATAAAWLHHALGDDRHEGDDGGAPAGGPDVVGPLVEARAAIRAVVEGLPGATPAARAALDRVLAHGHVASRLGADGRPERRLEVDAPGWRPAVLAALDLLALLDDRPERLRRCEHERCALWFLDTSRNGGRRWCSMATCGNRAKAQRHYRRARSSA
jgi:predicted RNA-binding Zn ribbon-like protein